MLAGALFPSPSDSPSRLPPPEFEANRPCRPMERRPRRLAAIAIGRYRAGSYRAGVGGPRLAEAASAEVTVPSPTLPFPREEDRNAESARGRKRQGERAGDKLALDCCCRFFFFHYCQLLLLLPLLLLR